MEKEGAARKKAARIGAWAYSSQGQRPDMPKLTNERPEDKIPNPSKMGNTLEHLVPQTTWVPRNTRERLW